MEIEQATVRQFQADVFNGHLDVHPLLDSYAQAAFDLLEDMNGIRFARWITSTSRSQSVSEPK